VPPEPGFAAALTHATPILVKVAIRLTANRIDAGDLVQDTLERAMRHGSPSEIHNLVAWLTRIMHNLFIDDCRASARLPQHEPLDDGHHNITSIEVDLPEPAWGRVTMDDVHRALERINPAFREVYVLHTFEHRSYEQIASHLQISTVTVGTRLTRVRRQLRKLLTARVGEEVTP
jgi:RNA polymerase sigma-70 factor (ECF subfamily)